MKTLETMKSAFLNFILAKRIIKALGFIIRAEIEYRKRLFLKTFVLFTIGGAFLLGGVVALQYLLFLLIDRYVKDTVISAAIVTAAFLITGAITLYAGNKFLNRFTSMDFDKIRKNLF